MDRVENLLFHSFTLCSFAQNCTLLFRSKSLFLKSHWEQFALYKRATVSELFSSLLTKEQLWAVIRSFTHKKRAIRLINQWAKSQPWFMNTSTPPLSLLFSSSQAVVVSHTIRKLLIPKYWGTTILYISQLKLAPRDWAQKPATL